MTSINGFPVSPSPHDLGVRAFTVPGTNVAIPVRADVAPLLIGFAAEFHRLVEKLHDGWCWGYAYREVRGGSTPSFHAAGIAIDLNAPAHPLGREGTFNAHQAATIRRLAAKYGLRWGGDYTGRKDEMHVEVILEHPAALALVAKFHNAPAATPAWYRRVLEVLPSPRTLHGLDVTHVQQRVGVEADGFYGKDTAAAVASYQKTHGLDADGVVGKDTARSLG